MNTNGNQFRPEEIVVLNHFDKKSGEWAGSEYPKVGGRLRIAHEQNETLGITSEVIQYDGNVAVVKALCTNDKGVFSGIGMASLERDERIAPAILELAETRAIARALRFSGIGVEYCSAEEVSHLDSDNLSPPAAEDDPFKQDNKAIYCPPSLPDRGNGGKGGGYHRSNNNNSSNGGNGSNGNGRLSNKQYSYLLTLGKSSGLNKHDLDQEAVEAFGSTVAHLSKNDASAMIKNMLSQ